MPKVRYSFSHSFGGTPSEQSRKYFRRLSPQSAFIFSQIHFNESHWLESPQPCLQNSLDVLTTIEGESDAYDVIVTITGLAHDQGI